MNAQNEDPIVPMNPNDDTMMSRRKLLKALAATSGAVVASQMLPGQWSKPLIESGVLPAHAQGSNLPALGPDIPADQLPLYTKCVVLQQNADIMLTVDASGSVGDDLPNTKKALQTFVTQRNLTTDQIGVISFDTQIWQSQTLTKDKTLLNTVIGQITVGLRTAVALGIDRSAKELMSSRHVSTNQRVIVLISDGAANEVVTLGGGTREGLAQMRLAARDAKAKGIRIICIAVGEPAIIESAALLDVASSPADFYYAVNPAELLKILDTSCTVTTSQDNGVQSFDDVGLPN